MQVNLGNIAALSMRDDRVTLGHYVVPELADPSNDAETAVRVFELRDRSVLPFQTSRYLHIVESRIMPRPIRYRLVSAARAPERRG